LDVSYEAFLNELVGLRRRGMRPGLEPTRAALAQLGDPHLAYRVVHVAGTNGKGSTAAMIEAIARAAGLRTGLYTSPHLSRFTERIRIQSREIAQGDVVRLAMAARRAEPELTFFETATVVALQYFREARVELAIVETGLGGRLDATNVVSPEVCVLTRIGLEHADVLGPTIEHIAHEKAGILKPGAAWLSAPQDARVRAALPPVQYVDAQWQGEIALAGVHQRENAALAAAAANALGLSRDAAASGIAHVRWPGRLETIGRFVLDCAHNPPAMKSLAASLEGYLPVVFGCLADKDAAAMLGALSPRASHFVFVRPRTDRGRDPHELVALAPQARVTVGSSLPQALQQASSLAGSGQALVTGSTYLIGEARELLLGEPADAVVIGDPVDIRSASTAQI
jgi:dihydrofolate synthase / folylpolyglutamate synthase